MVEPDNVFQEKARVIKSELQALRRKNLSDQIQLLKDNFPEVSEDAKNFIYEAGHLPWDFEVAFMEGSVADLRKKYNVRPSRHRPDPEDVSPLTDIFCEACDLFLQKIEVEINPSRF